MIIRRMIISYKNSSSMERKKSSGRNKGFEKTNRSVQWYIDQGVNYDAKDHNAKIDWNWIGCQKKMRLNAFI